MTEGVSVGAILVGLVSRYVITVVIVAMVLTAIVATEAMIEVTVLALVQPSSSSNFFLNYEST